MTDRTPADPTERSPPRPATEDDLPAIVAIDAVCFGNPWSADIYRQELERPFARLRLVEHAGEVVGFSCAWTIADEAHLLRIATLARVRGRGLGRALLQMVLDEATLAGCAQVLLEVAAGNAPAVGLYRAFGFVPIGLRKAYYAHPPDDALVMRRALAPG